MFYCEGRIQALLDDYADASADAKLQAAAILTAAHWTQAAIEGLDATLGRLAYAVESINETGLNTYECGGE